MTLDNVVQKIRHSALKRIKTVKYKITSHRLSDFQRGYLLEKEIGSGGFGTVYSGFRRKDGLPVAVKYIERRHITEWGESCNEQVPMEIVMLKKCEKVSGAITMLEYFTITDGYLIVMERPSSYSDLYTFLQENGPLDEKTSLFLFKQIVNTVSECFWLNVIHRDIKNENIVLDLETGVTKLVDFGAATIFKASKYLGFQGTRLYCPPEWLTDEIYLGQEATVWSLGIVLFSMLNKQLPFLNDNDICTKHLFGSLPRISEYSDQCHDLIVRCLTYDPQQRITVEEIKEHEWFTSTTSRWYPRVNKAKEVPEENNNLKKNMSLSM